VAFRFWAPHASQVSVVGPFNGWDANAHPMQSEPRGYWHAFVDSARIGDPYSYRLATGWGGTRGIDPRVGEVTHPAGDSIVLDPTWTGATGSFSPAPWDAPVIDDAFLVCHAGPSAGAAARPPGSFTSVHVRLGHRQRPGNQAIRS
jgi:1,4-alpha-glucan branching enzyme